MRLKQKIGKTHSCPHGSEDMAGDHVCGYVKGQCCRHCHKTYKQKLGFLYGLMVVVERLGDAGIFTHTAGKSNTKEDLPRKFLLPQKVQHNLT